MRLEIKQEYDAKDNGYPKALPDIKLFAGPPYLMPILKEYGITVKYQQDDNLDCPHRWAIEFWILLNSHFAYFHNNPLGDEEKIISNAIEECEILFRTYMANIFAMEDYSFSSADSQAIIWVESTKGIVWDAFMNNRLSSDSLGNKRGTARLFKELVFKLDELYDSFSETHCDSPYVSVDACILYNMWGDDYPKVCESIMNKEIMTLTDKAKVMVEDNKRAFYDEIERRVLDATKEKSEAVFKTKVSSLCRDLEDIFVDYMRHFRKAKIQDRSIIDYLCNHWRYDTIAIIHRAYKILSADYAVEVTRGRFSCLSQCIDGEEMYAHDKRAKIVEMATERVNTICDEFIENTEWKPWASKLSKLDIHYTDLYLAMKDRFFSGITQSEFEYAINEADFRKIIAGAKRMGTRSGPVGAIYFFVSELGDNLGKEWLKLAAESVTAEKAYKAILKIRGHSRTVSQTELGRLLRQHITYYKPRRIRNRRVK